MLSALAEELAGSAGPLYWVWLVILKVAVTVGVFVTLICAIAVFAIWGERKVAGHIQGRLGPKHVGPFGLFQSFADGIKLVCKEDLIPASADQLLYRIAPYIAFAPVFAAFLAIPFGPQFVFEATIEVGVLYLLAILGFEVVAIILAGWGSNSKWAVYGAMREACQMVSYEIPLGVSILVVVVVAGTLNLVTMSFMQGGGLHQWLLFQNPFIFAAFFIYFVASLASAKRTPFDLPEGESELVGGYHTEYSGMRWTFFFFAEYGGMFIIGCIQAALFLGGWNSPLGVVDPVYLALGYDPIEVGRSYMEGGLALGAPWPAMAEQMGLSGGAWSVFVLNAYGAFWMILKASSAILLHMWLRWTLPRTRIDQVMHGCVKGLLPVSLVMLCGAALWIALVTPTVHHTGVSANVAHLANENGIIQWVTQIILTILGAGLFGFYVLIAFGAVVHRRRAPRKVMFDDVMPVGKDKNFTRGPDYKSDA